MADETAKREGTTQDTGLVNNSENRSDKSTGGQAPSGNEKSGSDSQKGNNK